MTSKQEDMNLDIDQNKAIQKAHDLRIQGNTKQAILLYKELSKSENWQEQLGGVNGLALVYKMEEDYKKAIKYYHQAIKIAQKNDYNSRIGNIYRDIAISYLYLNKFSLAKKNFNLALEKLKEFSYDQPDNNPSYGITLVKLGYLYFKQEKYPQAEKYITQGQEILKRTKHKFWLLTTELHLAQVYIAINRKSEAEEIIKQQIKICKDNDWYYREIQCWLGMLGINKKDQTIIKKIKELIIKLDSEEIKDRFIKELKETIT